MIFLIAPYQERLCIIVVNASSSGPEAACVGSLQTSNCKKYFIAQKNQLLVFVTSIAGCDIWDGARPIGR